ncbi:SEL1-like repeat protein [Pseudobutyrivibrio ruminis]|uniref:Sel1 repeat-containing protein n=1 Tax=Pseudobutyrivibrio ruminis DSM 9787 TaxID=1123011 RepID=A0A285T8K1_9FIRM|nr:sel1 repeat family protein [Pseudobutyrivibrio ruminis]SOC17851.1 hypothetical protein SAMN02910411_0547 [Pseudobutyrivibrio ruminis DSM 9787]
MKIFNDYEEFSEAFEKAGEGDITAVRNMLNHLLVNLDDDNDPGLIKLLRQAYIDKLIDEGEAYAWVYKGDELLRTQGDEYFVYEALKCYLKAAALGDNMGFDCIGELYFKGDYVERDFDMSFVFFHLGMKHANTLNPMSLCRIGQMYKYGYHGELNLETAEEFFSKAISVGSDHGIIDDYALIAANELYEMRAS